MSSLRRIQRELADLDKNPLEDATGGPAGDDLRNWNIMLSGPSETPYEGGVFSIELKLPDGYPFKAPQMKFLTKIYHPNIKTETGEICTDVLESRWGPTLNIRYALETIRQLLVSPNAQDPLEPDIAQEFMERRDEFEKHAKQMVEREAK